MSEDEQLRSLDSAGDPGKTSLRSRLPSWFGFPTAIKDLYGLYREIPESSISFATGFVTSTGLGIGHFLIRGDPNKARIFAFLTFPFVTTYAFFHFRFTKVNKLQDEYEENLARSKQNWLLRERKEEVEDHMELNKLQVADMINETELSSEASQDISLDPQPINLP